MDWDKDTTAAQPTFVLKADRRYMVEQWGLGSWEAYFNGDRLPHPGKLSLGSRPEAQAFAEADYNGAERRLERLHELVAEVLDAYEAVGHGARFDPDQADAFRSRVTALS